MTIRVAINGFGRIGRTILRQTLNRDPANVEVVAINDIAAPELCAHLFAYDSVFGPYPGRVEARADALIMDGNRIGFSQTPDLAGVDWSGVDLVMECAGHCRTREIAERGMRAGAERVLISGPAPVADVTVVLGANDADFTGQKVVSNASCTTNALAPLLRHLDDRLGVLAAHMTTIHCYTGSQPMIDAPRGDFARSRAGALSMVPTTTSATELVKEVLPHLRDRLTGAAVRVPVASVSAVDVTARLGQDITAENLNALLANAVPHLIGVTTLPLVSSDLRARGESLIVAAPETMMTAPDQARIFGWYDNEWGFSARMIDMALRMSGESEIQATSRPSSPA